jgi:hypothetical protein
MASPSGCKQPAEGARRFGQSFAAAKKRLATIQIFGEYRDCDISDIPRLAGTPARLIGGFCVSRASLLHVVDRISAPQRDA